MEEFKKPLVVDEEIHLDPTKTITSKTNKFGVLEFANDYFMEVSGYEEYELMGRDMYCATHPDMPQVIFKMMWEKLLNSKENFNVVIKNLAKNGKYYWTLTHFTFKIDENTNDIAIYSKRSAVPREAVTFFSKFYKSLIALEKSNSIKASEKYILGFLETNGYKDFNHFIASFNFKKQAQNQKTKTQKAKQKSKFKKEIEDVENSFSIWLDEKPITKKKHVKIKTLENTNNIIETKVVKPEKTIESKPIKELNTSVNPINIDKKNTKKSLFSRLFGKTDEEIEEEKRRNKK